MLLLSFLPLGLNLLQLDDRGALELLGNDLSYLVMISFSSCEPCKFLTPHLIRLQANLNADGIPLMIATMDSETQPALGERHGIKDYPSLLLFVRGESVDNPHLFPGSTLQELVAWLREAGALATSRDALRAEVDARGEELPTGVVHPGQRMPELAELAMASRLQETSSPAAVRAAGTPLAVADEALLADCDGAGLGLLIGGQLGREQGVARWDGAQWAALGEGIGGRAVALLANGSCVYAGGALRLRGRGPIEPLSLLARFAARSGRWSAVAGPVAAGADADAGASSEVVAAGGGAVLALALNGSSLFVAGGFALEGEGGGGGGDDTRRAFVVEWAGGRWRALGEGVDATATALAIDARRGVLYVAGHFGRAGGAPVEGGVAAWDGARWRVPRRVATASTARPMELLLGAGLLYARDSDGGVLRHAGDGWEALPPLPRQVHAATGLAWAEGRLVASGECVQYEHGAVGCVAAWNGSAWHLAEQPAKGAALRGAVGYGELRALVRGEATFTPGPTLLAAARLGATDGIAWLHDESRWELLAVDGVVLAVSAPPAPGEPAADGPPRPWPAARPSGGASWEDEDERPPPPPRRPAAGTEPPPPAADAADADPGWTTTRGRRTPPPRQLQDSIVVAVVPALFLLYTFGDAGVRRLCRRRSPAAGAAAQLLSNAGKPPKRERKPNAKAA
jgi:thiol-disulfide isomerase/thioredoxin